MWLKSLTMALVFGSINVLCSFSAFAVETAPGPGQSTPIVSAQACPVAVAAVIARDSPAPRRLTGHSFVAVLSSLVGPSFATGQLWINASGKAYEVPFTRRGLLSAQLTGDIDPIAFTLPVDAHLENAFVSELADAAGDVSAPCKIGGVWTPGTTRALHDESIVRIIATPMPASIAAQPIADLSVTCRSPDVAVRTVVVAPADIPPIAEQEGIFGVVYVDVQVDVDSEVVGARIVSSPSQLLNAAALASATQTRYRAGIVACRPVADTYRFSAAFNRR